MPGLSNYHLRQQFRLETIPSSADGTIPRNDLGFGLRLSKTTHKSLHCSNALVQRQGKLS